MVGVSLGRRGAIRSTSTPVIHFPIEESLHLQLRHVRSCAIQTRGPELAYSRLRSLLKPAVTVAIPEYSHRKCCTMTENGRSYHVPPPPPPACCSWRINKEARTKSFLAPNERRDMVFRTQQCSSCLCCSAGDQGVTFVTLARDPRSEPGGVSVRTTETTVIYLTHRPIPKGVSTS